MDSILISEKQHLSLTQEKFLEIISETEEFFKELPSLYSGEINTDILNDLLTQTHNRIIRLNQGTEKPYFARIDYTDSESGQSEKYYIGKIGVLDGADNMVTLDWRAPVATLYYDSNVGEVEYESPRGIEHGMLELKRLFEIEEKILLSYTDVDTVSNDDLLRPYLGVNADNRLKNIISTIQSEQNRIIRGNINENLIVQGVAGSGKTTVALHRIAYLVYNNRDKIRPNQYMVIGPNRFFINYISSVLPDLDVDSVPQYTYADLAGEIIGESYNLTETHDKLALVVSGKYASNIEQYKVSMAYKKALDLFLKWYEPSLLPSGDFVLRGVTILPETDLQATWKKAMLGTGSTVLARAEQCIAYLGLIITGKKPELLARVSLHFKALYADKANDLGKLHRDRAYIEKELAQNCVSSLTALFKNVKAPILSVYRIFLQNLELFADDFAECALLKKNTLAQLRKKTIDPEDQAALLYLKSEITGSDKYKSYRHAVIDEAQDFGEFDFFALQKSLSDSTFTVVGDIAQAIYSYRSFKSWDNVLENSFEKGAKLCYMAKCYRTTIEIMEAANKVTNFMNLPPAEPVIRHGEPVRLYNAAAADKLLELIQTHQAAGYKSIAVISKTAAELDDICKIMEKVKLDFELITSESTLYSGGLCAMPGYLSKGLEFDGVIICDASENVYNSGKQTDMHLLYVAMTRPLHRLDIMHSSQKSVPLDTL